MSASTTSTPLHHKRWVHLALGLIVSGVCLWLASRELLSDPEAFQKSKHAFAHADYRTLPLLMLATVVFYWFKALRWRLLLKPIGRFRTARDLFPFVMIGFGFNNILPVHMGEVLRVLLFARHAHVKVSAAAASVVLERIFDSITVLTLLSLGLLFVPDLSPEIRMNTMIVAGCVASFVLLLLLYVFFTTGFIATVNKLLAPIIPAKLLERLTSALGTGATGLAALKEPRLVIGIMLFSLGSWVINGTVIHLALWSFGLPNSLLISCIVLGLTAVGAAVPSAPGYLGVIQFCFVTVVGLFSNDIAGIFAASIYYHLTEYVMVTLAGLFFFNTTGVSLAEAQAAAEEVQSSDTPDEADLGQPVV